MSDEIKRTIGVLLREFEIIKASLKPVLEETKNSRETKIELERTKKDLEKRIRAIESDFRKISQKSEANRDIFVLKDKMEKLQKDLAVSKSNSGGNINEIKKIIRAIISEEEFLGEMQKTGISRLKKKIDEANKNQMELISGTRQKIAGVLTELSKIKGHEEQIESELNKHKNAIFKLKDETKKMEEKTAGIAAIGSRLEKKHSTESGDIKSRLYKLDKKMITKAELDELKKDIVSIKEKMFGEIGSLKHQFGILEKKTITKKELDAGVKESIKSENVVLEKSVKNIRDYVDAHIETANNRVQKTGTDLSKEIEQLKNHVQEVVKELDRISIKVENTSKIISEMEKVL